MRPTTLAALTMTTLALAACGGEQPAPQPPPMTPPPPAMASATPPPAETPPPPPARPSLADVVPQTLKGIGDAFNAHDAKKVGTYYAEDCVVQSYGTPEREGHGRDDVSKAAQWVYDFSNDAKTAVTRLWIKGNVAVTEFVWAGTMTGEYMGMKPTKKPIGQLRVHVAWFNDDGLVKEQHEYGDSVGLMAQMKGAKGAPPVPTLPTNAPEMHAAKGSPDEDKLADWAKAGDEAFSKDDVKAAIGMNADDAEYWINVSGKPATKGKKDMTKELTDWFKAFPDQKWTPTNAWGIDGFAIIEHQMTGTQKGPMGPLPPSNKVVTNWHFIDIMQPTAEGKMQRGWGYANLVEMMAQTGAFKPPSADKAPVAKTDAAKGGAGKGDKTDASKGSTTAKADSMKGDVGKSDTAKDTAKKK
jgi:ketosteroid isomerase-like protein